MGQIRLHLPGLYKRPLVQWSIAAGVGCGYGKNGSTPLLHNFGAMAKFEPSRTRDFFRANDSARTRSSSVDGYADMAAKKGPVLRKNSVLFRSLTDPREKS